MRESLKNLLAPLARSQPTKYHWPKRLPNPHGSTSRCSSLPVLPAR